jgi:hypothetical protein
MFPCVLVCIYANTKEEKTEGILNALFRVSQAGSRKHYIYIIEILVSV